MHLIAKKIWASILSLGILSFAENVYADSTKENLISTRIGVSRNSNLPHGQHYNQIRKDYFGDSGLGADIKVLFSYFFSEKVSEFPKNTLIQVYALGGIGSEYMKADRGYTGGSLQVTRTSYYSYLGLGGDGPIFNNNQHYFFEIGLTNLHHSTTIFRAPTGEVQYAPSRDSRLIPSDLRLGLRYFVTKKITLESSINFASLQTIYLGGSFVIGGSSVKKQNNKKTNEAPQ